MCGGGSSKATREQQQYEQERQRQVNGVARQVRGVFDSQQRRDEISQYERDTEALYRRTLDRQYGDAERQMRFAMARSGQTGGQVAVDNGADLTRQHNEGVIKVSRAAAQAGARLRAADKETEGRLIGMAQAGLDMTNATQMAMTGLRDNIAASKSEMSADAVGQAFASMADSYQISQEAKARREGYEAAKTGQGSTPSWLSAYGGGGTTSSMPSWMIGGGP